MQSFGWDNDLAEVPALEFDAALSSSITEAQLLAGLSVSSGKLVIDMDAMLSAGASSGAIGVAWLTGKFQAGAGCYLDGDQPVSTGSSANNGSAGVALYHFADADPGTAPSAPPGGGLALMTMEWGRAGSGSRQYTRQTWSSALSGAANADFVGGTLDICLYTNGRVGIVRQGNTYPPSTSSTAIIDSRSVNSAELAADHRLRLALFVRLTGTASLPTTSIRRLDLRYHAVMP